jgi:hypothetical protein
MRSTTGSVDPIAVDAGALDDIANLGPDPEFDPPISRYLGIALPHSALALHGTTQRIHGTNKQDQQARRRLSL